MKAGCNYGFAQYVLLSYFNAIYVGLQIPSCLFLTFTFIRKYVPKMNLNSWGFSALPIIFHWRTWFIWSKTILFETLCLSSCKLRGCNNCGTIFHIIKYWNLNAGENVIFLGKEIYLEGRCWNVKLLITISFLLFNKHILFLKWMLIK